MLVFLITLLSVATLVYVAAPLWSRQTLAVAADTSLLERRDNLLRQIRELEFDYSMGKIEPDDYQTLRADLSSQTSQVLDQIEGQSGAKPENRVLDFSPLSLAEAALEIEVLVARARRKNQTWQCACGRVMANSDRFCASCGAPRSTESVSP
jgi:hypothetical protein